MTMHTNPLSPLAATLYPEGVSILTVARAETCSGAALLARATSAFWAIMYSLRGGYLGPWAQTAAASKFTSTRHAMSRIEILRVRVAVIVIAMDLSVPGLSARSSVPFPLPPGAEKGSDQFSYFQPVTWGVLPSSKSSLSPFRLAGACRQWRADSV